MRRTDVGKTAMLLVCAVVFLVVGIFMMAKKTEFKRNGVKTQAEIVRIEKDYNNDGEENIKVYVKYAVGEREYTEELDYYSIALKEGDIVSVYYLPSSPSKISYAKGGYFFPIAFMVASVGCLGFGVYKVISPFISRRKVDGNQSEN